MSMVNRQPPQPDGTTHVTVVHILRWMGTRNLAVAVVSACADEVAVGEVCNRKTLLPPRQRWLKLWIILDTDDA
jgi:hypothetical protein